MASWRACATREATRRRYRCREEGASPSPSHSGRCMVGPRPHSRRVGDTDYPRGGGLAGVDCAGQRQSRPGAGAVRRSLQTAAWDILHPGRLARLRNRSQQFQSPPIRGVSQTAGRTPCCCVASEEREPGNIIVALCTLSSNCTPSYRVLAVASWQQHAASSASACLRERRRQPREIVHRAR